MGSREAFSIGEWYHCYNRGVDKRIIFEDQSDYERFLGILYLANSSIPIHRSALKVSSLYEVLAVPKTDSIVSIAAFCLMPNHFHILLKEGQEGGITTFMRKLGTAYTMYFNIKNQRVGNLLTKPFRSKHVEDDDYFQRCVRYIHCNPAELYEPGWKFGSVKDVPDIVKRLQEYPYSSFGIYSNGHHTLRSIIDGSVYDVVNNDDPNFIVHDALAYYAQLQGHTHILR